MTLHAELGQQLDTAPAAGSVYRRARDGIDYLYAKLPSGAGRKDAFLGRAGDPEAEGEAERLRAGTAAARGRRQLIRMLLGSGFASPSPEAARLLEALADARIFERGGVVVGTTAYQLMEAPVGHFLPSPTMMTGDLDIAAATTKLESEPREPILTILHRADATFRDVPQLETRAPPWRFRAESGFLVDLLTPVRTRGDDRTAPLRGLDAGAFPSQQLEWLLDEAGPAVLLWRSGTRVTVPAPSRYAVHKLILAQRRDPANRPKRQKDLAQAGALIAALRAGDPFALQDALDDARAKGERGWAQPIARSLAELGIADL